MKPALQVVIATLLAIFLPGAVTGQVKSDEPAKTVRISGRVSDANGTSLRDVAVVLKLDNRSDRTITNEAGEYTFMVPPHRSLELHFDARGFSPVMKLVTAERDVDVGTLELSVAERGGVTVERIYGPIPPVELHPSQSPSMLSGTTEEMRVDKQTKRRDIAPEEAHELVMAISYDSKWTILPGFDLDRLRPWE